MNSSPDVFYKSPPAYEGFKKKMISLGDEYDFIKLIRVGKSVLKREIYGIGIGDLKNAVLLAGAFHAQEWLTASLLVKFAEDICAHYIKSEEFVGVNLNKILSERGIIIVPMVNPDGVEIALSSAKSAGHLCGFVEDTMKLSDESWQANARGVDINHNFDAGFDTLRRMESELGIVGPMPRKYGGRSPHSEPESKAMVNLCSCFDIKMVFAYHSQGEEIFWEYGGNTPKSARVIASALAASCGYKISSPVGTASHGGFKDWFIEKTGRCGFTIEIGRGVNPLPIEELEPLYARLVEMMTLSVTL